MPDSVSVRARIVITGAGGQVGGFLAAEAARRGWEVSAWSRRDWDITDPAAAERIVRPGDVVINCAAFTNVDRSEAEPEAAHAVNAVGPDRIARACAAVDARLVHISTDYVFGGGQRRPYEIGDPTNPLNAYARTKRAGELAVLAALPGAQVVRTSWVYTGGDGDDFVALMRRAAAGDRTLDVVDDQIGSPTYVKDLVDLLLELADSDVREPILHAANSGEASRCEQAREVFALAGADPRRVRPVTTAQMPRPAHRPDYSALSMLSTARAGLTPLRPWREALAASLKEHLL